MNAQPRYFTEDAMQVDPTTPTGISLKAAVLLLREVEQSSEQPLTVERLALWLDNVLRYEPAMRLIQLEAFRLGGSGEFDDFSEWISDTLVR